MPSLSRWMQGQAQALRQRIAYRHYRCRIGQRAGFVGIAQRLDQTTRGELQKAQQGAQRIGSTDAARRQVTGVIEHHRRIAVGAGQGNLRPGLELVAGFFGVGQHRHLHERILRMEQPKAFAPALQVIADSRQRQPALIPAYALGIRPAPLRLTDGAVGNGQQQPVLSDQTRRRSLRQGADLAGLLEKRQQAQLTHLPVMHPYRQPWLVEQIERLTHAYPPFPVATIPYPFP